MPGNYAKPGTLFSKMKKKVIILTVVLATILAIAIPFAISVNKVIDKFNAMGDLPNADSSYKLKASKIVLKNIRTDKYDTIVFDKIMLVNFWASWCQPCIEEEPDLERLASKISVIQLSFDSFENQQKIINAHQWNLPAYLINDTSVFSNPMILPTTIVLKDSIVVKQIYGRQNWADSSFIKSLYSLEVRP